MPRALPTCIRLSDELVLAGHMLHALDCGRVPMHAADYHDIAGWASAEFSLMDTAMLRVLRHLVPEVMRPLVENHLHRRRVCDWSTDPGVQAVADRVWESLRGKLAC
jgi:hypothetical protein